MWRQQNSNFKTMSSMQLHVVYLCFMTTPNKFSQEISLVSFTCPRDFGKVIGSRYISHVIWRVQYLLKKINRKSVNICLSILDILVNILGNCWILETWVNYPPCWCTTNGGTTQFIVHTVHIQSLVFQLKIIFAG